MVNRACFYPIILAAVILMGGRPAGAQEPILVMPIDALPRIDNPAPCVWGLCGFEIVRVRATVAGLTPIMRTQVWDARMVEILWHYEDTVLDMARVELRGDRIVFGRYLLMQVTPQDAAAAGTTVHLLALQWTERVRLMLMRAMPLNSRL